MFAVTPPQRFRRIDVRAVPAVGATLVVALVCMAKEGTQSAPTIPMAAPCDNLFHFCS
jgi:hypothetical protein